METITTIRRNSLKRISALFARNDLAWSAYSLGNGFSGEPVSPGWVRAQFEKFDFAKLVMVVGPKGTSYRMSVHSNEFYAANEPGK